MGGWLDVQYEWLESAIYGAGTSVRIRTVLVHSNINLASL